jgi:hypothetical protein
MEKDVVIGKSSEDQPCHWCKAGFIFVADQAHGTGKTVLCESHKKQFVTTFHEPQVEASGV